eukprot:scaffold2910_cov390-Prasinococcus_capsulatus_cf.AAC.68
MGACLSAPPQGSGGKREGISPKDSSRAPTADGGAAAKGPSATSLSTSATDGPEQPHGPPNKADSAAVPAAVAPAPPHGHTAPHAAKANDAAGPVDPSNSNGNGRSSGGGKELTQPTVEERKFACTLNRSGQLFAGRSPSLLAVRAPVARQVDARLAAGVPQLHVQNTDDLNRLASDVEQNRHRRKVQHSEDHPQCIDAEPQGQLKGIRKTLSADVVLPGST